MENIDPQKMRLLILTAVGMCIVSPIMDSIVTPLAFFLIAASFYDSRAAQNQVTHCHIISGHQNIILTIAIFRRDN